MYSDLQDNWDTRYHLSQLCLLHKVKHIELDLDNRTYPTPITFPHLPYLIFLLIGLGYSLTIYFLSLELRKLYSLGKVDNFIQSICKQE